MQKRMFVMQQKARQWRACCPEEWKPGDNNKIKLSAFYSRGLLVVVLQDWSIIFCLRRDAQ